MAVVKCFYCRESIQVANAEWVGIASQSPDCERAPDGKHARQVIHQPRRFTLVEGTRSAVEPRQVTLAQAREVAAVGGLVFASTLDAQAVENALPEELGGTFQTVEGVGQVFVPAVEEGVVA